MSETSACGRGPPALSSQVITAKQFRMMGRRSQIFAQTERTHLSNTYVAIRVLSFQRGLALRGNSAFPTERSVCLKVAVPQIVGFGRTCVNVVGLSPQKGVFPTVNGS
jgi:hypothetical protein